ncbi:MAG: NUDIX hydrolase [Planctomycetes bacterium]|nr:NUDIX hydrolase [Planctomycetota bacterium]
MLDLVASERGAWRAGDPRVAANEDLALARRTLERYVPRDAAQAAERERMLAFVDAQPRDAHRRSLLVGHLTASALLVDRARGAALLTHHKKLGRWLQLGGHCDGDANLAGVALRECIEESGIETLAIDPTPLDLDIHVIPARKDEPEHLHLDTRFVVFAPPHAAELASDESHALRWVRPRELAELGLATDDSVRRLFALVFGA